MISILMCLSNLLIIASFLGYVILILVYSKRKISKVTGFDATKDIISEYDSINVIEGKGYFTIYNIKRKVIKLTTRNYYGKDLASITVSLIEAGVSIVDKEKNNYIKLFSKVTSNLKTTYILPLIALIINYSTYNISDAKVSVVVLVLFTIISYMIIDIHNQAYLWISDNIKKVKDISKKNKEDIIGFIRKLLCLDKMIFFGEVIMILRYLLILFEIN